MSEIFRISASEIPDFIMDERAPYLDGSVDPVPPPCTASEDVTAPAGSGAAGGEPTPAAPSAVVPSKGADAAVGADCGEGVSAAGELNPGGGAGADTVETVAAGAAGAVEPQCANSATPTVAAPSTS